MNQLFSDVLFYLFSSCFVCIIFRSIVLFLLQRKYVPGNAPPLFMSPSKGSVSCPLPRGRSHGLSRAGSRASVLGPSTLQSLKKVLEWSPEEIRQWATDFKLEYVCLW